MKIFVKTLGWMFVSGMIIFCSSLAAGVAVGPAFKGAVVAKIGTTIAYLFYELAFEKAWSKPVIDTSTVV